MKKDSFYPETSPAFVIICFLEGRETQYNNVLQLNDYSANFEF